ncbi:hypothetical protein BLSTO_05738, partial [Blastocystis sp. subtype 1]
MSIENGWFYENETMWSGQRFGLKVKEVLYHEKSEFQDILLFDSESYGRVMVLDGVIQVTERDEFAYQEMITHLPLFAHRSPKNVLIVGGGDGGVLREVAKHPEVEHIVMCEIDKQVVDVAKKYLANCTAVAFDDPRVELLFMDAALYVKEKQDYFDVIIVDSSDPVGPAESLYTDSFYNTMKAALKKGGIICTQGECQWLHLPLIRRVMDNAASLYSSVRYAYTTIPTYPCGQIGFIMAIKDSGSSAVLHSRLEDDLSHPNHPIPKEMEGKLRYYTEAIHKASF